MQKCGFIARVHVASPRGQAASTYVARRWRGADVDAIVYIFFIKYMGLPCIRRQRIKSLNASYIIYPWYPLYFLQVGLFNFLLFYFRATWRAVERRMGSAINRARRSRGIDVHGISD